MTTNPLDRLDPNLALRPGDWDARAVLGLWVLRKSFFPLVWLGLSIAFIAFGDPDALAAEIEVFDSPQAMVSAILSPLGVVVAAFVIRIASSLLALAAAFPLTLSTRHFDYAEGNRLTRFFHLWWDRLYQARAYRSLRWTWSVRVTAHRRLGEEGRAYEVLEFILLWANIVFFIVLLVVLVWVGGQAAT